MSVSLGSDLHGPLTEFLSDGISLARNRPARNQRYRQRSRRRHSRLQRSLSLRFSKSNRTFNSQSPAANSDLAFASETIPELPDAAATGSYFDSLPADDEVPDEILEFFQPEAEEHLQIVSDCLISLEGSNNPEEINKLFRAIHTVKGSAAQVGLKRLGAIAHRVEDLIGRLRDGELEPSPSVVDVCLESVDILKKTLHREFIDDAEMRTIVDSLLGRIAEFAPADSDEFEAINDPEGAIEVALRHRRAWRAAIRNSGDKEIRQAPAPPMAPRQNPSALRSNVSTA